MEPVLEFVDDPAVFLDEADALLGERPVEATVVASVTAHWRDDLAAARPVPSGFPTWWLLVRDERGAVVGAAMRTAPFAPHPPYLLAMPDATARAVARALHERGEQVAGVNGALPAVEAFAEAVAVLDAHAALDAFTAWRRNRMDVCLCEWPVDDTSDPESVRSLRAV
jgi:hypothetical protein